MQLQRALSHRLLRSHVTERGTLGLCGALGDTTNIYVLFRIQSSTSRSAGVPAGDKPHRMGSAPTWARPIPDCL